MRPSLRILLLNQNRYVSLLIERELSRVLSGVVITKFADVRSAVEELSISRYHAVVVDLDTVQASSAPGRDDLIGSVEEDLPIILLVSPEAKPETLDVLGEVDIVRKERNFQVQIPDLIIEVIRRREEELARGLARPVSENSDSLLRIITNTLSHEINNPLMTILGSTELLLERRDLSDRELIDKLQMIHDSAQRIQTRLTNLANLFYPNLRNSSSGYLITTQK